LFFNTVDQAVKKAGDMMLKKFLEARMPIAVQTAIGSAIRVQ